MSILRWAIVGTGTISRSVVPDLRSCADVSIEVVHSRTLANAERFAEEFGIPRHTDDFESLLADDTIDCLYIATPFATHFTLCEQALQAGKHVLVEKPMAMNANEVEKLFAIAAQHQVFLMEGMWMKFNPAFRALHDELEAGRIGEVRNMRAAFSIRFPDGDSASRWDVSRSGSALLDQGIYPVTLAHSVFGVPTSIHAVGTVWPDGLDIAEHFTLEFEGGRFAQCVSGMNEFADPSAAVSGTAGWIVVPAPFWATTQLEIHADDAVSMFQSPKRTVFPLEGNGYVPMLREVVSAIAAGELLHPVHGEKDTVEVFAILDEIRAQIGRKGKDK